MSFVQRNVENWAGWQAWYEIDKARENLHRFRVLHEAHGSSADYTAALTALGISEGLWTAYLDASKLLRDRGF